MSQQVYIVAYDIVDDRRRTRIYTFLRGWGDHLQFSVFRIVASPVELARIRSRLDELVHQREDQILFFNLGPVDGRAKSSVTALGLSYTHPERHVHIV